MVQKTSAWPLALVYAVLIVFASLFPFDGWRAQGIDPLVFLTAKIPPPYWTWSLVYAVLIVNASHRKETGWRKR